MSFLSRICRFGRPGPHTYQTIYPIKCRKQSPSRPCGVKKETRGKEKERAYLWSSRPIFNPTLTCQALHRIAGSLSWCFLLSRVSDDRRTVPGPVNESTGDFPSFFREMLPLDASPRDAIVDACPSRAIILCERNR